MRHRDLSLAHALVNYVFAAQDPMVARFHDAFQNWEQQWIEAASEGAGPAARWLSPLQEMTDSSARSIIDSFHEQAESLFWEQSYRPEDGVVGDDMLGGYGFVEMIGKRGPFVSEKARCGIGVWGPDIVYPTHHHQAEELYMIAAGNAVFTVGDAPARSCEAGDVVHVPSNTLHGFETRERPLAIVYVWQHGDLRQTSSFVDR